MVAIVLDAIDTSFHQQLSHVRIIGCIQRCDSATLASQGI